MAAIGARAPESTHLQDTVAWLAQQACASERVHSDATDWVIPTLYFAARHLDRPDLAARAGQAARWGVEMQLTCGAARGGVAATGQALLAWLTAFADTGWGVFAGASRRASRFLFSTLDDEGLWRRGGPYCTRSAWALAEAARRLGAPELRAAAARHLRAVARLHEDDGWMGDLADIADALRGLLEGGRVLGDERLIGLAARGAAAVAAVQTPGGRLPNRFVGGWRAAGSSWCPVGQAQMANVWLRLHEITGASLWLEPVRPALRVLAGAPRAITGTKFYVDALMREERIERGLRERTGEGELA